MLSEVKELIADFILKNGIFLNKLSNNIEFKEYE